MDTAVQFLWHRVKATGGGQETEYRFGCSATIIGNFLWLMGGPAMNRRIALLDLNERVWKEVKFPQSNTYNLLLHSATLYGDGIVLMGVRRVFPLAPRSYESGELHVFDPVLCELRIVPTFGEGAQKPGFRKSHTMDLYEEENTLVLFGGLPHANSPNQQLFLLNMTSKTWRRPTTTGQSPSMRSRHGSSLIGSRLYIYGGDSARNELYVLDLKSPKLSWDAIELGAMGFNGRVGPVMVYVGSGRLIIYGGYTNGANSSDICIVETANSSKPTSYFVEHHAKEPSSTSEYVVSGRVPAGRECPRAMMYNGSLLIIGGNARDKSDYYLLKPM